MKNILYSRPFWGLLIVLIWCIAEELQAKTYYISSSIGNNSYTESQAQNPTTPWQNLENLHAGLRMLSPGDTVLFRRGDVFEEPIVFTISGLQGSPIVISSFGDGEKPVITGLTTLSDWVLLGGGVWETSCTACGQIINLLLINGSIRAMGRYPNSDALNKGYLTIESHTGSTSITSSQIAGPQDWSGAELVTRTNRWILDRNLISNHSGATIYYKAVTPQYQVKNGFGFFIQNHPATLDSFGEWYYNPATKKLRIFFGSNAPTLYTVQVPILNDLVRATGVRNIKFEQITFEGANRYAFNIQKGENIQIDKCDIIFSGVDGVYASYSNNLSITNSIIAYSNNGALFLYPSVSGSTIRDNTIKNIGTMAGMGGNGDLKYIGIRINGADNLLEFNAIDSTGYTGIFFSGGSGVVVKNNYIKNFCFVKDDGGGIYTWNNSPNSVAYTNQKIIGNIVLNGIGAPHGVANPDDYFAASGIYVDDNAANIDISGNTVANSYGSGFFNHNARNLNVKNNSFYNNAAYQINLSHDSFDKPPVTATNLTNNIFFAKTYMQGVASFKTVTGNFDQMGAFDKNYYCRPLDDSYVVYASYVQSGKEIWQAYDIESWKRTSKKDIASRPSPVKLPAYKVNRLIGANKFSNGSFSSDVAGVAAWSQVGNVVTLWHNNKLDTGTLQVAYQTAATENNPVILALPVGEIAAAKKYVVKFSMRGSNPNGKVAIYLRQYESPWSQLSYTKYVDVDTARSENELLFSFSKAELDASLIFKLRDYDDTIWIDNVEVFEADVTLTNPDDYIRFEYNSTNTARAVPLDGTYVDAKGNIFSNSINLAPYTSAVLMKQSSEGFTEPLINQPPAANAGPDQVITLTTSSVVLQGTGNDPEDGTNVTYAWKQVKGPTRAVISTPNQRNTTVSNLLLGLYTFRLQVTDTKGTVTTDVINFIPKEATSGIIAYPNPFESTINIKIQEAVSKQYNIIIYDVSGDVLLRSILTSTPDLSHIYRLDLSHPSFLRGGFYILEISNVTENIRETIKILKSR